MLNVACMQKIKIGHRAKFRDKDKCFLQLLFPVRANLHCISTSGVLRARLLIEILTNFADAYILVIFFSVRERAVFYKSCDLIGSGSGRYSPIRPAHSGRYPMRDESSITSLTSLQFFINYKDTYHENL